jgi:hypothetical protein
LLLIEIELLHFVEVFRRALGFGDDLVAVVVVLECLDAVGEVLDVDV